MTVDDLEDYVVDLDGFEVGRMVGADGQDYLVIRIAEIPGGSLAGRSCEVAVLRSREVPWVPQAALHVRPALLPMGQSNTQASPVGPEWQYWSRRYDRVPTPRGFMTHVLTVLAGV